MGLLLTLVEGNGFLDFGTDGFWFWYGMFSILVRHVSDSGTESF